MERTSVGYSWRGPHGRLDPLDQRSPARARSFAHSLARPGTQAPQPLAENPYDDTMSGVPTTEKCLLPRVVMRCPLLRVREGFPYAVERRGEVAIRGKWMLGDPPYGHWASAANRVSRTHHNFAHWIASVATVIRDETCPPRQR